MCGGCGRVVGQDWLAPAIPSRTDRDRAASTVSRLVEATRLRVCSAAAGFTVHHPTGRVVVAPTLSAVWAEVLRSGRVELGPPPSSAGCGPGAPPVVPHGQLVLLLADSSDLVARRWAPERVVRVGEGTSLVDVLSEGRASRVLAWARRDRAAALLATAMDAAVRLRVTTTAVMREGDGPAWATDVGQLDDRSWCATLAGEPETIEDRPGLGLPEAAAWVAGLLAVGRLAGSRLTVRVAQGSAVIDAAHGYGLAVRPTAD